MSPDAQAENAKLAKMNQLSLFIDVLLIAGCGYLLFSDLNEVMSAVPAFETRGIRFMLNLTACFALVYRGMMLIQRLLPATRGRRSTLVLKWLLLLGLPIAVAGQIERMVYHGHMQQLDQMVLALRPVIERSLQSKRALQQSELQSIDAASGGHPYLHKISLRSDTGAYALTAQIPWLSVDPLIGLYLSTQDDWQINPPASADSEAAQMPDCFAAGASVSWCQREKSQWRCSP